MSRISDALQKAVDDENQRQQTLAEINLAISQADQELQSPDALNQRELLDEFGV